MPDSPTTSQDNPYKVAADPTAQTLPLTRGQSIVSCYEMDLIAEPCDLAEMIDKALAQAWEQGRLSVT